MEQRTPEQQKELEGFFSREGSGNLIVGHNLDEKDNRPELSFFLYPAGDQDPAGEYRKIVKEQMEKAGTYAFVPDCSIELYSLPILAELLPPAPDMSTEDYIRSELLPYTDEIGLVPEASVCLRNLIFAQEHGIPLEGGNLPRLSGKQLNQLVHYHTEQDELADKYGHNPVYELPVRVIETSKGMLFFSNNELGQAGLKNYYQNLTDNYFSVHSEAGPVRQYYIDRISPDMRPYIDAGYRKDDSTGKYEFAFFDQAVYQRKDFNMKNWALEFETGMQPCPSEFLLLAEHSGSRISAHNNDVWRLLVLKEHGYDKNAIQQLSSNYRYTFLELGRQIDNCINSGGMTDGKNTGSSKNLFDLIEEVQGKATDIIKNEYDIRGHRSFERTMKDLSYDPLVGDIRLSYPVRQAALEGKCIYLPEITGSNPGLHYICADKEHEKLRISATPFSRQIYREENGKIVPFQPKNEISPKREKVSKAKKSNGPKL
ncbi:DUF6047 family protein [Bacteroides intestinalis]|uniref:DUF6047 family protein n=1 Tax=Bacteroides intestinalis TaxID=329854 RepID=UPI00189D549E|nr:DUF6047 family protein [Bacteroides intestinalis]